MGVITQIISVGETSASIKIEASYIFSVPTGAIINGYEWSGNVFTGKTTVASAQGTVIFSPLKQGVANTLSINISCTCNYSIIHTSIDADGHENSWTEIKTSSTVDNLSLTVYTHPGSWEWGAVQGNTISKCLTAAKDEQWIDHFQKVYHWFTQSNKNYSFDINITNGDLVTASWYNDRAKALNSIRDSSQQIETVSGGPNGDSITAKVINKLNFNGVK